LNPRAENQSYQPSREVS